jgi:hypothetical protein
LTEHESSGASSIFPGRCCALKALPASRSPSNYHRLGPTGGTRFLQKWCKWQKGHAGLIMHVHFSKVEWSIDVTGLIIHSPKTKVQYIFNMPT